MRHRQINVRLSDEENESLRVAAEVEGTTIAAFVRSAALEAAEPDLDDDKISEFPSWVIFLLSVLHPRKGRGAGSDG